jgi:hypothetical protein
MALEAKPIVGNWYRGQDGQLFEIVAIDETEGVAEIQYFDGEVDELDLETWDDLELEAMAEPEDWSGPFDDLERDDLGYTDMTARPAGHIAPFDEIDQQED